jgi:hypothetical protein
MEELVTADVALRGAAVATFRVVEAASLQQYSEVSGTVVCRHLEALQ